MNSAALSTPGTSNLPDVEEAHTDEITRLQLVGHESAIDTAFNMPTNTPEEVIARHCAISRAAVKGDSMFDWVV